MQLSPFTDFCFLFLSIVLEGAPFILLGTVISGIIDAYLPPGLIDKWLPKNKPLAVVLSALLGSIFPVCECTIVPVIRRLIKKGLPISCAVTYMLSSPIINPITVISTMNAFSTSQTNPFKILKVDREAGDEQIKEAFERQIERYRPDEQDGFKNEDAKLQYSKIQNAYRQIETKEARASYERMAKAMSRRMGETYSATYMTASRLLLAFMITVSVGMILLRVRKKQILAKSLAEDDSVSDGHHDHHHGKHIHSNDEDDEDHHHSDDHDHEDHDHDHHDDHDHSHDYEDEDEAQINRPVLAMRTAMRDFIETAMYFTIGVAITAVFKAFVTDDLVLVFNQSEPIGVGLMMMLAFILSLCSTSDAFIAANFPVPQSAKLAFLVYGPMMDVKLIFMYLSVFTRKFVVILAVALFFAIGILSYVWFQI